LRFRLKIGERNISNEIKIKKTLFRNELRVLNIKLYEKILIPRPRKAIDFFSNKKRNKLVVEIISASYK
jgi:hypothetical protein